MADAKVWLGGEGPSEIGDRDRAGGERVGAIEALLRQAAPAGWRVAGARRWQHIRKFRVGAAIGRGNHADIHGIAGLVNEAHEAGCAVVAFARDVDADDARADAIVRGIAHAAKIFPAIGIIGGPAIPALEGWILALRGVRDTERMSRSRANELLAEQALGGKHAEDYVEVIERADPAAAPPPGCDAFTAWRAQAKRVLGAAVRAAAAAGP